MKEEKEKLERILLVDYEMSRGFLPSIEGVKLEVLPDGLLHNLSSIACRYIPDLTATIKSLTERGMVDYVVIGNLDGAGINRAASVAENMRADRACIVWNSYGPGIEVPYEELGFRHLMSRRELSRHLEAYFRGKYSLPIKKPGWHS